MTSLNIIGSQVPEPGVEPKSANIKFVAPFFSILHSLFLVSLKFKKLLSILKCFIIQENVGHKTETLSSLCSTLSNAFSCYVKLSFNFQNFFLYKPLTYPHPTYPLTLTAIPSTLNILP